MGSRREKFLCPHCHRLGREGGKIVCGHCAFDYGKVRAVERLIRETTGMTELPQEIFLELWIWRCRQRKDVVSLTKAETLKKEWKSHDHTQS
jgi:hypothetical protein